MRIWVTRAQPGADATAARLRARGHDAIVSPVIETAPRSFEADLTGVGALAFTSARSPAPFAAAAPASLDLPVFTVGDATASAARDAGYADVRSADGAVGDLARLIAADHGDGAVLAPGALEPAGDLAGDLAGAGVEVRRLAIYETRVVYGPPPWELDAVTLHSPMASRRLADLAMAHPHLTDLAAYVLSEPCAAPLRAAGFTRITIAEAPNEDALLGLLP